MSSVYDSWERLVGAVLNREKLREIALCDSFDTIISSDFRSRFSFASSREICSSFKLDRSTGTKCYMLSARELEIAWIDNPMYWKWKPSQESRFGEVAELKSVWWLDIRGKMRSQILSPNTNYAAFIVFNLAKSCYGLDSSTKASVKVVKDSTRKTTKGDNDNITTVCIDLPKSLQLQRVQPSLSPLRNTETRIPSIREDGWLEIMLGEFLVEEGDEGDVLIQLYETERLNWKMGLIVEGIEVRPKESF